MPPFVRLLILRESKKHAAFSLAASACPTYPPPERDATGTPLAGGSSVEDHTHPLSF